jgi:pimeloyl-ACP methyl ester carboxylesterase
MQAHVVSNWHARRLLGVLLIAFCWYPAAGLADSDERYLEFTEWFHHHYLHPGEVSESVKRNVRKSHFVIVPGLTNEIRRRYYEGTREFLKEVGVPDSQVHWLAPSSFAPVEMNATKLARELQEIPRAPEAEPGEPDITLIAHSMGAAVALQALLDHPEVAKRVKVVISENGALRGSPLASYFVQFRRLPNVKAKGWLSDLKTMAIVPLFSAVNLSGIRDLQPIPMEARWKQHLTLRPDVAAELSPKVFYVAGVKPGYPAGEYLSGIVGANDGALPLSSQLIPGFGRELAVFWMDHGGTADHRIKHCPDEAKRLRAYHMALMSQFFGEEKLSTARPCNFAGLIADVPPLKHDYHPTWLMN